MTKPTLIYFDAPVSRGEECRLAFAAAGVDFEDRRIKREEWAAMKPTSPFGALPVLEVPGKAPLAQSNAILTYIGVSHGLHPTEPFEAARHHAMMESVEELRHRITPSLRMTDEAEKVKARELLARETIPQWAAFAEKQVGDGPFFAGAKLHVVDVKVHMLIRWIASGSLDHVPADTFAPYPKLVRLHAAVGDHPAVKAWRAKSS